MFYKKKYQAQEEKVWPLLGLGTAVQAKNEGWKSRNFLVNSEPTVKRDG
jgi:hypothetical protein